MGLEPEGDSTVVWRHLPADTAGTQSGEEDFSSKLARLLWGTVVAELELEPATGLQTVLSAELVKM